METERDLFTKHSKNEHNNGQRINIEAKYIQEHSPDVHFNTRSIYFFFVLYLSAIIQCVDIRPGSLSLFFFSPFYIKKRKDILCFAK